MLLEAKNLSKFYNKKRLTALLDASFVVPVGKTLGVVGESGSGKSTLAKLVLHLVEADGGEILFYGELLKARDRKKLALFRKKVQVVFQEPYLSLDPRMRVSDILEEPFRVQGLARTLDLERKVFELLGQVELPASYRDRYPHELSGGECQRVAIARAISTDPELIVCDEPVSSLDAIVQIQILNLLLKIQKEKNVAYLFISHDLRVVRHMSDFILVMQNGRIVEQGPRESVFQSPQHDYTKTLIANL